jgi:hypothetical protein
MVTAKQTKAKQTRTQQKDGKKEVIACDLYKYE